MRIPVKWKIIPAKAGTSQPYQFSAVDLRSSDGDDILGLPAGTMAVLREAFSRNLSRNQSWSVAGTNHPEAVCAAAALFRRGVSVLEFPTSEKRSGQYAISSGSIAKDPSSLKDRPAFFVIDHNVLKAWPKLAGLPNASIVESAEAKKTLQTVAKLRSDWAEKGLAGHWVMIGGGLVGDLGAFAASFSKCSFELVPTTLLAMIDACVGGKSGVNFPPYGKNQLGHFAFPTKVTVDHDFLSSIGDRQFRSGLAEGLKHAILIGDWALFDQLVQVSSTMNRSAVAAVLPELIQFKANVVAIDPDERSMRAVLNLGHTMGHAIESLSIERTDQERQILHGEAVGLGMVFAILLSQSQSGLPDQVARKMLNGLFESKILPGKSHLAAMLASSDLRAEWSSLRPLLTQDKKNQSSDRTEVDWVLLTDIGRVVQKGGKFTMALPLKVVESVWDLFLSELP